MQDVEHPAKAGQIKIQKEKVNFLHFDM